MLTREDLVVTHVYRGKRYTGGRDGGRPNNDRVIVWMGDAKVQYDSDTVGDGRRLPTVEIEKFMRWAKADVTEDVAAEKER